MTILIPQAGCILTLSDDWSIEVDWRKRNLRMLKAFKLTGMVVTGKRGYYIEEDDGKMRYEQRDARETVPNKLFMDDEGNYNPVLLTFEKGTEFELSRFRKGWVADRFQTDGVWYDCARDGAITEIDIKCIESPMKGIKGLCLQFDCEGLNGMPAIISNWPNEDEYGNRLD